MDIQADLPEFGSYDIDLTLDDKPEMPLTFWVVPTPS